MLYWTLQKCCDLIWNDRLNKGDAQSCRKETFIKMKRHQYILEYKRRRRSTNDCLRNTNIALLFAGMNFIINQCQWANALNVWIWNACGFISLNPQFCWEERYTTRRLIINNFVGAVTTFMRTWNTYSFPWNAKNFILSQIAYSSVFRWLSPWGTLFQLSQRVPKSW